MSGVDSPEEVTANLLMASTIDSTALVPHSKPASDRDVDTVPFVELSGGRVQGVVSSGSDIERVYCAFIEAASGDHYSSTNNNRPDAGTAKRIRWLLEEAVKQFGAERVARYLQAAWRPGADDQPGGDPASGPASCAGPQAGAGRGGIQPLPQLPALRGIAKCRRAGRPK